MIRDGIYSVSNGSIKLVSVRSGEVVGTDSYNHSTSTMRQDAWNRAWGMYQANLGEPTTEEEDVFLGQQFSGEFQYMGDWTE